MEKRILPVLLLMAVFNATPAQVTDYEKDAGYIEYLEGNMPLVISIPHDGEAMPDAIPERPCTQCSKNRDIHTIEIGRTIREQVYKNTGYYPYIIINHLHRTRLDPNRNIDLAAGGNILAEKAWHEFHNYIDSAIYKVERDFGKGLYIDLHGHRHSIERIELGYLLTAEELRLDDDFLNDEAFFEYSSLRHLINANLDSLTYTELIRGEKSFGTMLENSGYACVPSSAHPYPLEGEPIFSGGFNTNKHSSVSGGKVDGIQVEIDLELRKDPARRKELGKALAGVLTEYIKAHYFRNITY